MEVWGGPKKTELGSGDQPGWQKYPKVFFRWSYSSVLTRSSQSTVVGEVLWHNVTGNYISVPERWGQGTAWVPLVVAVPKGCRRKGLGHGNHAAEKDQGW